MANYPALMYLLLILPITMGETSCSPEGCPANLPVGNKTDDLRHARGQGDDVQLIQGRIIVHKNMCKSWCPMDRKNAWSAKCTWRVCAGCEHCIADAPPPTCKSWCPTNRKHDWSVKCKWKGCAGCQHCIADAPPPPPPHPHPPPAPPPPAW